MSQFSGFRLTARFFLAGLAVSLAVYLLMLVWIFSQMTAHPAKADVIIVPGARSYISANTYNPCLIGRVNTAVKLYNDKMAPRIIFSGGNDSEDGANEAQVMSDIAHSKGVPYQDMILEADSGSTYQNLLYSQKIMKEMGFKSALIVAEPFHIPRVSLVARHLKMKFSTADALTPCWTQWTILSRAFLREPFALVKYIFDGKI